MINGIELSNFYELPDILMYSYTRIIILETLETDPNILLAR